ncbi:MAG: phosphate-starvation-inducible PsiE family protein [Stellaceae bacterium]
MRLRDEIGSARALWLTLTIYGKFEQGIVLILITLIALIIAFATLHLAWNIVLLLILGRIDPADPAAFQTIFGMIFTVLIALEFKHSLRVVLERRESVIQVRTIVLIAILALVRKFIILDLSSTAAEELFGLAAAILALGVVYWLVRDQDRREGLGQDPEADA